MDRAAPWGSSSATPPWPPVWPPPPACPTRPGGISGADLGTVTELHCDGRSSASGAIRSLEGVQQLSGLSVLDAPRNGITDLTPLAALPRLGTLTLTDNAVSDLSPLAGRRRWWTSGWTRPTRPC